MTGITDFDWVAQLRYYWERDNLYVKMVQATLAFGYEYLGNQPRLVVRPVGPFNTSHKRLEHKKVGLLD